MYRICREREGDAVTIDRLARYMHVYIVEWPRSEDIENRVLEGGPFLRDSPRDRRTNSGASGTLVS